MNRTGKTSAQQKLHLERRKSLRHRTIFTATVGHKGRTSKCTLFDLSVDGCKVQGTLNLEAGDSVEVFIKRLGNFKGVMAEIAWTSDNQTGLRFTAPLEQRKAIFANLLPSRLNLDDGPKVSSQ